MANLRWGRKKRTAIALGIGFLLGACSLLIFSGVWPNTPIHASATDRIETYAIATGAVDEDVEAVFFLDFLTGDLTALVLGKQSQRFNTGFATNVMQFMQIDPSKNPKFLMTTGYANFSRGTSGRTKLSHCVVYVAEVTTGTVAAFAIPWSMQFHMSTTPAIFPLQPIAMSKFRHGALPGAGEKISAPGPGAKKNAP